MTPAEAKRVVLSVNDWQLNPEIPARPNSQDGAGFVPQSLQTFSPSITEEVCAALNIHGCTANAGGSTYFIGGDINTLADAGANFRARKQFLAAKTPASK